MCDFLLVDVCYFIPLDALFIGSSVPSCVEGLILPFTQSATGRGPIAQTRLIRELQHHGYSE